MTNVEIRGGQSLSQSARRQPQAQGGTPGFEGDSKGSPQGLTRRGFLKGAAVILAAASFSRNAGAWAQAQSEGSPRVPGFPFFPFCIDWHDSKKRSFKEQAQMLKELGYEGVGHIWLDKVDERLKTLDEAGLKLFQITMTVDLTAGKPAYDARFKDVLALVKGRGVQFCLLISGAKPSDESADPRGLEVLRGMSDLAQDSGSQLLLYPHVECWVERIEDSVRVAGKVERPNVGAMFNLCHWLRVDKRRDYEPLLKRAMPRLWAVSINGADEHDDKPGWDRYIQPLDKGTFDIGRFLKTLKGLGYRGPIGLQCYGIGGDTQEHLARSMTAWRHLSENLRA